MTASCWRRSNGLLVSEDGQPAPKAKSAHRIGTRRLPPPPGQPAYARPVLARFSGHEDQQAALKKAPQVRTHWVGHRCRINEDLTLAEQQLKKKLQPVAQRLYNEQGIKAVWRRSQLCWCENGKLTKWTGNLPGAPEGVPWSAASGPQLPSYAAAAATPMPHPHAAKPAHFPASSRAARRPQWPQLWWQQPDLQPRRYRRCQPLWLKVAASPTLHRLIARNVSGKLDCSFDVQVSRAACTCVDLRFPRQVRWPLSPQLRHSSTAPPLRCHGGCGTKQLQSSSKVRCCLFAP